MVKLGSKLSDGIFCITCGVVSRFDKIINIYDAFNCNQCQKPFIIEARTTPVKDSQVVINSTRFKIIATFRLLTGRREATVEVVVVVSLIIMC